MRKRPKIRQAGTVSDGRLSRHSARESRGAALEYREFEVRASSIDVEARSVEAVVSTENPVPMFDWDRYETVPEILLTSGAQFPDSRQVPLLDSHMRSSMEDQLGSARELAKKEREVRTRLFFSETADEAFAMVREGHARDVSAGYQVQNKIYVPKGTTQKINGRDYSGPVNVVTKWKLREVSLTPIGADEQAKLRGLDPAAITHRSEKEFEMDPELKKLLVSRGMDATLSDEDAQKWLVANSARLFAAENPAPAPAPTPAPDPTRAAPAAGLDPAAIAKLIEEGTRKAVEATEKRRADFHSEIRALCELAELPGEEDKCRGLADVAAVRAHLAAEKKKQLEAEAINPAPRIRQTGEGIDQFVREVSTELSLRSMKLVCEDEKTIDKLFPAAQRAKNVEPWKNITPYQIAEQCLARSGISTVGLTREQVAITALFGPEAAGVRSTVGGAAYHVTGSFLKITQDAFNKSMMVGYQEAPSTWEGPMRQGASTPDFKTIHRIAIGGIPNLPVWNDNVDPQQASFADAEETYVVECRSLEIGYSYRLLINDDMNALSTTPAKAGQASRRTVNAVAWSVITANPTMRDSVALFAAATGARKRDNLQTGSASPTTTTVGVMRKLMRLMRGENTPEGNEGDDVLNLEMRYLVVPAALELLASQVVNSAFDPNATTHQVYNPNRQLTLIVEPLLDANSATAFYGFCSPSQMDTVEITFLTGQETPAVRMLSDERKLSKSFIVLQTFGAKALNHRGVQKHNGA